jgi:hypothetical protein
MLKLNMDFFRERVPLQWLGLNTSDQNGNKSDC